MSVILALDLGTTTDYALGERNFPTVSGSVNFAPASQRQFDGAGMRYVRFLAWMDKLAGKLEIGHVVYEEVRAHKGTGAAQMYGGFRAHITTWCEHRKIPYEAVPVQQIKKYATGKGNASKDLVIENVRKWGFDPVDDNEADAIALLRMTLEERG